MPDIELRHFRCFLALAEDLHFTSAAKRLFVTQQTLSRTIAQLEHLLGEQLFVRNTRSVQLTPGGEAMVEAARAAILAADQAVAAARGEPATAQALRVDISSGGLETGALIVREMRTRHPDVGIHQAELGLRRSLEELRRGRLDLILGLAAPPLGDLDSEIIRAEPVLVGMAGVHPLAAQTHVAVAQLAEYPLLLPDPDAAQEWIDFVFDFCQVAGVRPRRWPHITHGSVAAAEALRESDCLTPTNAWLTPPPDLAFRPLVDPNPVFPWSLIWDPKSPASQTVNRLRACAHLVKSRASWVGD